MKRYYDTAKKFRVKNIIRITSDCPLIDVNILDNMINRYKIKKFDYYSNTYPEPSTYPDGMDIEIFRFKSLKLANMKAIKKSEENMLLYLSEIINFKIKRKDLARYI